MKYCDWKLASVFLQLCVAAGLAGCTLMATGSDARYQAALDSLGFEALAPTFSVTQVDELLEGQLKGLPLANRRAAAALVSLGALEAADLADADRSGQKLSEFVAVLGEPHQALVGRIGDPSLLVALGKTLDYAPLLGARAVRDRLGYALEAGAITGYDLRAKGIYAGFPAGHTLIYSHSDPKHLRQLVSVLSREGVEGWVYVTPKVSAFLYREDWGSAGANVTRLPSGTRVVQGQEMAVLFRFPERSQLLRFHSVVQRFAKRDSEDEEGLIAGSWWQPFYYADEPIPGFDQIALLVLGTAQFEATLTVPEARAAAVLQALQDSRWPVAQEKIWVNPAFFRFLQGDYK